MPRPTRDPDRRYLFDGHPYEVRLADGVVERARFHRDTTVFRKHGAVIPMDHITDIRRAPALSGVVRQSLWVPVRLWFVAPRRKAKPPA